MGRGDTFLTGRYWLYKKCVLYLHIKKIENLFKEDNDIMFVEANMLTQYNEKIKVDIENKHLDDCGIEN